MKNIPFEKLFTLEEKYLPIIFQTEGTVSWLFQNFTQYCKKFHVAFMDLSFKAEPIMNPPFVVFSKMKPGSKVMKLSFPFKEEMPYANLVKDAYVVYDSSFTMVSYFTSEYRYSREKKQMEFQIFKYDVFPVEDGVSIQKDFLGTEDIEYPTPKQDKNGVLIF